MEQHQGGRDAGYWIRAGAAGLTGSKLRGTAEQQHRRRTALQGKPMRMERTGEACSASDGSQLPSSPSESTVSRSFSQQFSTRVEQAPSRVVRLRAVDHLIP
ncbi:hypothetical protein PR202_gb16482 [Eleusine coracana subsp. coracana]|uniref:Uncharacterized protein n=1 Tax=Eleusine coracana subsp. coracana TaxID=191504 RepID=A0AAV5F0K8_ELECO|nr:hypothetical protein PR202_gb16482 [Eleusine coracana subsp. coracana]